MSCLWRPHGSQEPNNHLELLNDIHFSTAEKFFAFCAVFLTCLNPRWATDWTHLSRHSACSLQTLYQYSFFYFSCHCILSQLTFPRLQLYYFYFSPALSLSLSLNLSFFFCIYQSPRLWCWIINHNLRLLLSHQVEEYRQQEYEKEKKRRRREEEDELERKLGCKNYAQLRKHTAKVWCCSTLFIPKEHIGQVEEKRTRVLLLYLIHIILLP